ncbi:MAG: GNAT family N-acetyltransferase [Clostridia bacterium]|nr:GNAT family N-acetyltransferase [Clostridia bacterium]
MIIRRAVNGDIGSVIDLLSQVLEIHAKARPDIFVPGTTKYSEKELAGIFANENTPVYVAETEENGVVGYVFCVIMEQENKPFLAPCLTLYIDDLCVDSSMRGRHVGRALFDHAVAEAKRLGCHNVTLNVWEGNDPAKRFYESMGMKPMSTHMEFLL